uniref:Ionotropic glutamate receptor L-glutamate and glycine-binding domain-containing protein n=1 Tax=Anopheles minimus TaxID=112268 RepID=A0A182VV85_9DIPT
MTEAVVPCCLLPVLLLLLHFVAVDPLSAVLDRDLAGVDLISRTLHTLEADAIIRERLIVLEQRFVGLGQDPCTGHGAPLIVFLQFRTISDEHAADDILSLVIEAFTRQTLAPRVVYRVEKEDKIADMVTSMTTSAGNDSSCIVLIMLLPDLTTTDALFPSTVRAFPLALKLILLANGSPSGDECPAAEDLYSASSLLSVLWRTEHIVRTATVWYRCSTSLGAMSVGLFDLFAMDVSATSNDSATRGIFYTVADVNRSLPTDLVHFWRNMNLQGMPIDIYGFEAAMAYRRQDIDMMPTTFPVLRPGTANVSAQLLDSLFGADVDAVRELALRMNFTPRVHYMRTNFGFKMVNGTFTGVLGRLVARESWLSMNVYFLKDYETRDLQFSAGVYQDSLCVFVQAAGMLPDWLLIFRCFTPTLWIIVWSTVVLVSLCYLALAQAIAVCRPAIPVTGHVRKGPDHTYLPGSSSTNQPGKARVRRTGLVGQIVGALLNAPTNGLQRTTAHQKLFVAFGLIWGLTITGAFQVKRPGTTIGNLKQRIVIEHVPARQSAYSVLAGLTAGLIRNQDFVRLSTKYLSDDGTARLHRLRECLRSYTLAYVYPRGSPLYRAANGHILHFLQHGLYAKWQRDAAHLLAMNRALKVHARSIRSGRPEHGEQMTLRLDHLLLPFMVLGAGVTLGA